MSPVRSQIRGGRGQMRSQIRFLKPPPGHKSTFFSKSQRAGRLVVPVWICLGRLCRKTKTLVERTYPAEYADKSTNLPGVPGYNQHAELDVCSFTFLTSAREPGQSNPQGTQTPDSKPECTARMVWVCIPN